MRDRQRAGRGGTPGGAGPGRCRGRPGGAGGGRAAFSPALGEFALRPGASGLVGSGSPAPVLAVPAPSFGFPGGKFGSERR